LATLPSTGFAGTNDLRAAPHVAWLGVGVLDVDASDAWRSVEPRELGAGEDSCEAHRGVTPATATAPI
jgi:hypothetical protein